ncbi:MAG: hypothetical protein HY000_22575 [Planctomycetes bacterium]|nr:hypothetical protein [Planctomycetota bacterium]
MVKVLHEQAEYLLDSAKGSMVQSAKENGNALQADALLTEAIQLCRALAAEFPNNADYKHRLENLLKLQAEHVGQLSRTQPAKNETTPQPEPEGA